MYLNILDYIRIYQNTIEQMTDKYIENVLKQLSDLIKEEFSEPIKINAIVKTVDPTNSSFIVHSNDKRKEILCHTTKPVENLHEGDIIQLIGNIRLRTNGSTIFKVDDFYNMDTNKWIDKKIKIYKKLKKYLLNNKRQEYISNINKNTQMSQIISNIGLIVLPNKERYLENFKISFQENCKGNLFIYHLKENTMESGIRSAIEYFKKYHQIDLICILLSDLSTEDVITVSSKDNVSYFLNRKKCPPLITITTCHADSIPFPLISMICNHNYDKISNFINDIRDKQYTVRNLIKNTLNNGYQLLEEKTKLYSKKVFEKECLLYKLCPETNPLEIAKELLIQQLERKKEWLMQKEISAMHELLNDDRVNELLHELINIEEKLLPDLNSPVKEKDDKRHGF